MNYELLDKLIPARRLPGDPLSPREALAGMLQSLESLRKLRATQPGPDEDLDKQVEFYERILES